MRFGARYTPEKQRFFIELRQTTDNRKSRLVSYTNGEVQLPLQITRQSFQRCAAASEDQAAIKNVARNFRRQIREQLSHFIRNATNYGQRDRIDFARIDIDSARTSRLHIAATHVNLFVWILRFDRRTQLEFQSFGSLHSDC